MLTVALPFEEDHFSREKVARRHEKLASLGMDLGYQFILVFNEDQDEFEEAVIQNGVLFLDGNPFDPDMEFSIPFDDVDLCSIDIISATGTVSVLVNR